MKINYTRGTPRTLRKAIENALEDYNTDQKATTHDQLVEYLRVHVADFTRNKLGPIRMADGDEVDKYIVKFLEALNAD